MPLRPLGCVDGIEQERAVTHPTCEIFKRAQARKASVGGVEPKEMDNWINAEASAIPFLSPRCAAPLRCGGVAVWRVGVIHVVRRISLHKSQRNGVNCTSNQSYRVSRHSAI